MAPPCTPQQAPLPDAPEWSLPLGPFIFSPRTPETPSRTRLRSKLPLSREHTSPSHSAPQVSGPSSPAAPRAASSRPYPRQRSPPFPPSPRAPQTPARTHARQWSPPFPSTPRTPRALSPPAAAAPGSGQPRSSARPAPASGGPAGVTKKSTRRWPARRTNRDLKAEVRQLVFELRCAKRLNKRLGRHADRLQAEVDRLRGASSSPARPEDAGRPSSPPQVAIWGQHSSSPPSPSPGPASPAPDEGVVVPRGDDVEMEEDQSSDGEESDVPLPTPVALLLDPTGYSTSEILLCLARTHDSSSTPVWPYDEMEVEQPSADEVESSSEDEAEPSSDDDASDDPIPTPLGLLLDPTRFPVRDILRGIAEYEQVDEEPLTFPAAIYTPPGPARFTEELLSSSPAPSSPASTASEDSWFSEEAEEQQQLMDNAWYDVALPPRPELAQFPAPPAPGSNLYLPQPAYQTPDLLTRLMPLTRFKDLVLPVPQPPRSHEPAAAEGGSGRCHVAGASAPPAPAQPAPSAAASPRGFTGGWASGCRCYYCLPQYAKDHALRGPQQ